MNIAVIANIESHRHLLVGSAQKISDAIQRQDFDDAYRLVREAEIYRQDLEHAVFAAVSGGTEQKQLPDPEERLQLDKSRGAKFGRDLLE